MLTRYLTIGLFLAFLAYLAFGPLAGGVLASVVLGFMAGNFACSLIHRLPRGKSILENKPYCGSCAHPLSERDLLPVIGALLIRHKCRYCGAHIPYSHFWTEVLIGALFALCYVRFGFSESYILVAGVGVFLIILACIEANDKRLMPSMMLVAAVLGMLLRTLQDGEIFNFLQGGLFGLVLGGFIWRREIKPVNHIYTLPDGAKLLAMGGIIAGGVNFWLVFVLFAAFRAAVELLARLSGGRASLSAPLALALMVPLLWPGLTLAGLFHRY